VPLVQPIATRCVVDFMRELGRVQGIGGEPTSRGSIKIVLKLNVLEA